MSAAVSIDSTKAMIQGVKEVGICIAEVLQDGKLTLADVKTLRRLMDKYDVLFAAVRNAKNIPAEVNDLSQEEITEILLHLFQAFNEIKTMVA